MTIEVTQPHNEWKPSIIFLWVCIVVFLIAYSFSVKGEEEKTTLQICQESYMASTNVLYKYNEENPRYKVKLPEYDCNTTWTASGAIIPLPSEPTLRNKFWLWDCRFINSSHKIPNRNLNWIAYDIACDKGKSFDVRSPWEYIIENIGYGNNLGNYIILRKSSEVGDEETRIVLGHTVTTRSIWDKLSQWDIVGQSNLSWASTWIHVHIELWEGYYNVGREFVIWKEYPRIDWTPLLSYRKWDFWQPKNKYYFTAYNLWDEKQNDSSPCIWASWKDLCYLERNWVRTMALTSDIRNEMGIKFWDKVRLTWESWCEGVFQVEDEMNQRFRQTPWILRPWTPYYIKWDLPSKEGWTCSITKL